MAVAAVAAPTALWKEIGSKAGALPSWPSLITICNIISKLTVHLLTVKQYQRRSSREMCVFSIKSGRGCKFSCALRTRLILVHPFTVISSYTTVAKQLDSREDIVAVIIM